MSMMISGLIQTSFDQVFITTCLLWLLTPQSSDKQMMVTNMQTRHHNFRIKMKIMSYRGACSPCACTACRTDHDDRNMFTRGNGRGPLTYKSVARLI